MALPVLPNPDNFLGVALVIKRAHEGPRFVFHYPAYIAPPGSKKKNVESTAGSDLDDDDILGRPTCDFSPHFEALPLEGADAAISPAELANWNHDDYLVADNGAHIVPWEYVAGFPTQYLGHLLTPARPYHKRRFQVSLDTLYCVSYPIYVPESGVWKKKRKKGWDMQRQGSRKKDDAGGSGPGEDTGAGDQGGSAKSGEEKDVSDDEQKEQAESQNQVEANDGSKLPAEDDPEDKKSPEDKKKSSMDMFNLVFFLNPKKHETRDLIDLMFTHIIKKVNKAYKYCQQRADFVRKESKKILRLKDKGREERIAPSPSPPFFFLFLFLFSFFLFFLIKGLGADPVQDAK